MRYFESTTLESFDAYRESFYTCSSLWNARKGAMIYNVIISAFFGPKSALKNCYADELAHTEIAPFVPRELSVAGALERGRGEALIRQVLPGDTAYTVCLINLDALPERASELIIIIGREFGGEIRSLPASQDVAAVLPPRRAPSMLRITRTSIPPICRPILRVTWGSMPSTARCSPSILHRATERLFAGQPAK